MVNRNRQQEPVTYANTRDALIEALDEFDNEAILSLLRPGRLAAWKARLFDLRVRLESPCALGLALAAVEPTCEPGCVCGDPTLCGTVDPSLVSVCPKCGALVEDLDGFGVLVHDECGYCSHPDSYGGKCVTCASVTGMRTEPGLGYATTELRVGLTERELRFWVEGLAIGGRRTRSRAKRIGIEIERAVDAAIKAGMVTEVRPYGE